MASPTNSEKPPMKRTRRRPALSCMECRERKIKCDRNRPCDRCTKSGLPNCTYTSNPRTGSRPILREGDVDNSLQYSPKTLPGALSPAIAREVSQTYRQNTQELPTPISTRYFDTPSETGIAIEHPVQSNSNSRNTEDVVQDVLHDTIDNISNLPNARKFTDVEDKIRAFKRPIDRSSNHGMVITANFAMTPGLRGVVSKSRLFGQSHWASNFLQFDVFNELAWRDWKNPSSKDIEALTQIFTMLEKCKALTKILKAQRPEQVQSWTEMLNTIPSREIADELLENYFRAFESVHRILHIPSFRAEYEQFWITRQDLYNCDAENRGFVMKLVLVLAIGFCLYDQTKSDALMLGGCARQWIYAAISWISGPVEKNRLTLTGLQVQCLIHMARTVHSIGANMVCISANTLLDTAVLMGLHRDPDHFPHLTVLTSELRRRLWATILEMVLQSELAVGRCIRMSLNDFDTKPPTNLNDDDISENSKSLQARPDTEFTQTSLQIFLHASWPLRFEAVQAINNSRADPTYDEILRLSSELMAVNRESVKILLANADSSTGVDRHRPTPCDRNLYHCFFRRLILSLHRPFAAKARKDPRYYFSRKICMDSALLALHPEPDVDYHSIITFAAGIFRDFICHAGASLFFEVLCQLDEEKEHMMIDNLDPQRERLKAAIKTARSLMVQRVERADYNVKVVVFMTLALSQIEAMEANTEARSAVIEGARESSVRCYEILKTRRDATLHTISHDDRVLGAGTADPMSVDPELPDLDFDILGDTGVVDLDYVPTWLFPGWSQLSF